MLWKLRDQKLKIGCISNPHGNHKPKIYNIYSHKKGKESKHGIKDSHQIIREENQRGREEKKTYQKNTKQLTECQ